MSATPNSIRSLLNAHPFGRAKRNSPPTGMGGLQHVKRRPLQKRSWPLWGNHARLAKFLGRFPLEVFASLRSLHDKRWVGLRAQLLKKGGDCGGDLLVEHIPFHSARLSSNLMALFGSTMPSTFSTRVPSGVLISRLTSPGCKENACLLDLRVNAGAMGDRLDLAPARGQCGIGLAAGLAIEIPGRPYGPRRIPAWRFALPRVAR